MAQKFVGIDLGNRRVKIAVVTAGLRGAQVLHLWEQAVEGKSEDPLDAAIQTAIRMLRERGLRHLPTGVSLPGGEGSYRLLTFPFEDPKQIAQTLLFEIDGQFPVPVEQLAYDHLPIKRGDGRGRALVVATKRALVEHIAASFKLAEIDLRLITAGALSVAQALASTPVPSLPPGSDPARQAISLVVDFGHKHTELVALASSGPIAARSFRRGGKQLVRELARAWRLDPSAAELALERDASLEDEVVVRALQPLLREIEHTRQWLRTEIASEVVELRLCGGGARLRGLAQWLTQQTGLPTQLVAPRESAALRQVAGRDWSVGITALGTAVAAAKRPLIQLFDSVEGPSGDGPWIQQHFSTFATLGVAILAFAAVDTIVRIKAAERERDAYVSELERESGKVFGRTLTSGDEVRAELAAVEGGGLSDQIPERGALELLELITKAALPKGGRVVPAPIDPASLPPGVTTRTGPDGNMEFVGPDGSTLQVDSAGNPIFDPTGGSAGEDEGEDGGGQAAPVEAALAPVSDPNAGIQADDQLVFSSIDIRELKIEMSVAATRSTAQDRLAVKLTELGCIREITKGMIKDRNQLKAFDMVIDHTCFTGSIGGNAADEPAEVQDAPAAGDDEEGEDGED